MLALIGATIAFSTAAKLQLQAVDTDATTSADATIPLDAGSPEYKQVAVAILNRAKEAFDAGNPEEAQRLAGDAARIQVQWSDGELTPTQLLSQMQGAQNTTSQDSPVIGEALYAPEYERLARELLREARDFLSHGEFDQAEELAAAAGRLQTKWWQGEQTPAMLIAEIRKARRFQSSGQVSGRGQRNQ